MICKYCNKKVNKNDKYCQFCGNKIDYDFQKNKKEKNIDNKKADIFCVTSMIVFYFSAIAFIFSFGYFISVLFAAGVISSLILVGVARYKYKSSDTPGILIKIYLGHILIFMFFFCLLLFLESIL